jgi:hypothetical protein
MSQQSPDEHDDDDRNAQRRNRWKKLIGQQPDPIPEGMDLKTWAKEQGAQPLEAFLGELEIFPLFTVHNTEPSLN